MTAFAEAAPRVFVLPPGVDFPAALARGLCARMAAQPPEAMARVTVYVSTARMRDRIARCLAGGGPMLLPRLRLVTDVGRDSAVPGLPAAVPPLRRRLELSVLIARLLDRDPTLAPRAALYDLADSLADLLDEMQGEGVTPDRIAALDVSQHSAHWARARAFMAIVAPYFADGAAPDAEARQRLAVRALAAGWAAAPPADPVIVAGSTGSRGTTLRLMQAVAGLPQGALVLPGFDDAMPESAWTAMGDALTGEDHPQFRFLRLLQALDLSPGDVRRWTADAPPDPARNRLVSLSLRPAPVTDQWLTDGAALGDLGPATEGMTLVEADSLRAEAVAVALILRDAVERGCRATLVSADRVLTRQVTAALDRWRILPDDSAGRPLALSAPGRLLRQVAEAMAARLSAEALLALLKHPLVGGGDRGPHLLLTRELELHLRRHGPPHPAAETLRDWAGQNGAADWGAWLAVCLPGLPDPAILPLSEHVARHRALAERLAAGPGAAGSGDLWNGDAGIEALKSMAALEAEAPHGGALTPAAYRDLFGAVLARGEVRGAVEAHPDVLIWGTREARVGGCDLVILGGLNEGSWPERAAPDPWMNRAMRASAGLLLPERRIGLAAHDYQQAVAAREVVLTRAHRDAEAPTIPSRWLNRLTNLMAGLGAQGGAEALAAMRARGDRWLALALALDAPEAAVPPEPRPAPRPPVAVRPRQLSVTEIATLIRDPYAIYARHILRLSALDPLRAAPDARLRGTTIHRILERFVRERPDDETSDAARARLQRITAGVLADTVPWPSARALWRARMDRATPFLLGRDAAWAGTPVVIERKGAMALDPLGFMLTAKPDRIDVLDDGRLHVIDYKTGTPPTPQQQLAFDKQLILTAAMAERGAFPAIGPREVARVTYVGLGSVPKEQPVEVTPGLTAQVCDDLARLIATYLTRGQGYAARRAVTDVRYQGDYDHLARLGEWSMTDPAQPGDVG